MQPTLLRTLFTDDCFPLHLKIKVSPRSPRTEYNSTMADGTLKIRLRAVPEKGKANAELIRFLAEEFQVPESAIEILSGGSDAMKLVRVGEGDGI